MEHLSYELKVVMEHSYINELNAGKERVYYGLKDEMLHVFLTLCAVSESLSWLSLTNLNWLL